MHSSYTPEKICLAQAIAAEYLHTGGTVTVDGTAFISGNVHIVTGNTAIVSTAA